MKETDVAAIVVDSFRERGWKIYEEPQLWDEHIPDIVAVNPPSGIVMVVEVKVSLSAQVVAQALYWREQANYVAVAIPHIQNRLSQGHKYLRRDLMRNGIGLYLVDMVLGTYVAAIPPVLNSSPFAQQSAGDIVRKLENHKNQIPAGSKDRPKKERSAPQYEELVGIVQRKPGIRLSQAVKIIEHGYGSDKEAVHRLGLAIKQGMISGIVHTGRGQTKRNFELMPEQTKGVEA